MSDTFLALDVRLRSYGGAYIARAGRFQASCTSSPTEAVRAAATKAWNADPKVLVQVEPRHIVVVNATATGAQARLYLGGAQA